MPERWKFYNATKSVTETVAEWAARVPNLAAKCDFGNELEIALRDKFIMGLDKKEIMQRLFEEKISISFDHAIEIASAHVEKTTEIRVKEEVFFTSPHAAGRVDRRRQSQSENVAGPSRSRTLVDGKNGHEYSNDENDNNDSVEHMFNLFTQTDVAVRDYRIVNKPSWIKGIIKKKIGTRTYFVFIPSLNKTWKRHVNQIIDYNFSVDTDNEIPSSSNEVHSSTPTYQVCSIFSTAYGKSATVVNAEKDFTHTGLYPFNPYIFPEYLRALSETTQRLRGRRENPLSTSNDNRWQSPHSYSENFNAVGGTNTWSFFKLIMPNQFLYTKHNSG
ncbi:hypothetical protein QE152_g7304 [Popillia japonica]|uniref:Uncharacterized protein n=1 Tax=Popillia japonica TaxID=7064 RepID=A0AAW1MG29_POPJA